MKKKLEMLEELQEIDQQIDVLKGTQSQLSGELDVMDRQVSDARIELSAMQDRTSLLESEKSTLENSHAAELENIRRSEANMKEIKTNKEYQAVGREIAAARKQVSELEEQILQKIEQIEAVKAQIGANEQNLVELEKNIQQGRNAKQAEISKIQQDIDLVMERRDKVTKVLPANLVKRYVTLRSQRRGQALAIARDGACMGCNMNLPPQLYNSLYRGDDLITCPHCQRVLILKQPLSQQ